LACDISSSVADAARSGDVKRARPASRTTAAYQPTKSSHNTRRGGDDDGRDPGREVALFTSCSRSLWVWSTHLAPPASAAFRRRSDLITTHTHVMLGTGDTLWSLDPCAFSAFAD
jgi:hypothetical protein